MLPCGSPVVGKPSVAQALAVRTGFRVLHNHLLVDLADALFERGAVPKRGFCSLLARPQPRGGQNGRALGVIVTFV